MSTGIVTQGVGYVRCWYGDVGMVGVGMVGVCMAGVFDMVECWYSRCCYVRF